MQTIPRAVRGRRERGPSLHRSGQSPAAPTFGDAPALGVETLARRSGQALPTLESVPTSYNHEVHSELLYDFCAALVRCGVARPHRNGNRRAKAGTSSPRTRSARSITADRLDLLQRNLEYHLQIADVIEKYGYDRALETSELAVMITSGNCGYFEIGEALEALEAEEKGWGRPSTGSSLIPSTASCAFITTMTH